MNKFLVVITTVVTYVTLSASTITISEKQQKDLGVRTQEVSEIESIPFGPYNGTVVIDNKDFISMGTKVEASIENIYVKKFDTVKKGQKLYALASSELLNLQSEYIEALIESEVVDENYQRNLKLKEQGVISEKKLLASQKLKRSSDLKIKLTRTHLEANGINSYLLKKIKDTYTPITRLIVYAPRSGLVNDISVNIGEVVSPDKSIMSIYADGQRFIELVVPVKTIDKIAIGDKCTFSSYEASVSTIGRIVNESSLSVLVRAKIKDSQNIMLNRVYQVEVSKDIKDAVKVKKSALVFSEDKSFVFKKIANGFDSIEVEIIKEGPTCYILKAKLHEGDEVAVSSTSALLSAMEE